VSGCCSGVYPLHRSLAPYVSAPFPPLSELPSDKASDDTWNGAYSRAFQGALPRTLLSGITSGLAQGTTFWQFQEKAHREDKQFVSYWTDFDKPPTSLMDQAPRMLLPLLPSHVQEQAIGAEYWGYNQDLAKGGHAFHCAFCCCVHCTLLPQRRA
jgi:hypothetical protein